MTNKEAKQEAIKKAYGEHWDKVKEFCDSDGWITNKWIAHGVSRGISYQDAGFSFEEIFCQHFNSSDNTWRLKSIYSILTNNGWIRIEPDGSNLPTSDIGYKFSRKDESIGEANLGGINTLFRSDHITHYKPIKEEPKPVY